MVSALCRAKWLWELLLSFKTNRHFLCIIQPTLFIHLKFAKLKPQDGSLFLRQWIIFFKQIFEFPKTYGQQLYLLTRRRRQLHRVTINISIESDIANPEQSQACSKKGDLTTRPFCEDRTPDTTVFSRVNQHVHTNNYLNESYSRARSSAWSFELATTVFEYVTLARGRSSSRCASCSRVTDEEILYITRAIFIHCFALQIFHLGTQRVRLPYHWFYTSW